MTKTELLERIKHHVGLREILIANYLAERLNRLSPGERAFVVSNIQSEESEKIERALAVIVCAIRSNQNTISNYISKRKPRGSNTRKRQGEQFADCIGIFYLIRLMSPSKHCDENKFELIQFPQYEGETV